MKKHAIPAPRGSPAIAPASFVANSLAADGS